MIKIIPSTLVQSEQEFLSQIKGLGKSLDMIQLDIADGKFVNNTTWADPDVVRTIDLAVELHLMVENPLEELERWKDVKQVNRVLAHYESIKDRAHEAIHKIQDSYEWAIGIAVNPETDISVLEPLLPDIQLVMFMGVHPGKQGQGFLPETLERIRQFKKLNTEHLVSVDGAVNEQTIKDIQEAGADIVCPGSAVFHSDKTPAESVEYLQSLVS